VLINREVEGTALAEALSEQSGHRVQISASAGGERRAWLNMANQRAVGNRQRLHLHSTQEARLATCRRRWVASSSIGMLISATSTATPLPRGGTRRHQEEYRHYNQDGRHDDYGAMREVLTGATGVVAGEGKLPDLILTMVAQVSSARSV
jgi:excinuclease ABC subunit C